MHKEFKDGKVVVLDSIATWMARKIAASFVLVKKTFTNRKGGRGGRGEGWCRALNCRIPIRSLLRARFFDNFR